MGDSTHDPRRAEPTPAAQPPLLRSAWVDPAQLSALRVIVTVIAAQMAQEWKERGLGTAQSWVNQIAARSQEAVGAVTVGNAADEQLRREVCDQINYILAGIRCPADGSAAN